MPQATSFWFVDLPWWAFWPLLAVAVLIALFAIFVLYELWEDRDVSRWDEEEVENRPSPVVYPYYVESGSLRELAHSVKLDLPTGKQVTKSKRLSFNLKGTGGEKGDSETEEYEGQLPLLELAQKVQESSYYGNENTPATDVADAAAVSDESALSAAVEQIQRDFPSTSQTAELLSNVQRAFSSERVEALSAKKREEFEGIAKENQMLVFKGQFAFLGVGPNDCGPTLRLTHFNPTPGYMSPRASDDGQVRPDLIPVPEGVGLNVALPDKKALTPAGSERILRNEPFFAGLIAHSPSFDSQTGILTCSAWAIWGEKTPDWHERANYRYRGVPHGAGPGYPDAC